MHILMTLYMCSTMARTVVSTDYSTDYSTNYSTVVSTVVSTDYSTDYSTVVSTDYSTVVSTVDLEVSAAPKDLKAYNWAEVRIIGVVFKNVSGRTSTGPLEKTAPSGRHFPSPPPPHTRDHVQDPATGL